MSRKILLIEPAYKNKYPPLGLMKISAYHKMLGDDVTFFKGKSDELREIKWDRIYITTLFSFYWNITIDTIKFYKRSVKKTKDFYIGGIMASLMADEIYDEIHIKSIVGLLDKPKMLNDNNDIIVDHVVPDYDILEEIDYAYPTNDAYFFYTTRGCVRKCPFCAVPKLEPKYKSYISIREQIKEIDKKYGCKKNLLLLDNNVLASKHFPRIIEEIKEIGFYKGAKYQSPLRNKTCGLRYVDFNQGIDPRFITEEKMRLLSEIPINPLRIAFDTLEYKKKYIQAIELAAKYGIKNLSNSELMT
ncbi:MAG: radical SAM protein [Patescibacteria group bacterium]